MDMCTTSNTRSKTLGGDRPGPPSGVEGFHPPTDPGCGPMEGFHLWGFLFTPLSAQADMGRDAGVSNISSQILALLPPALARIPPHLISAACSERQLWKLLSLLRVA